MKFTRLLAICSFVVCLACVIAFATHAAWQQQRSSQALPGSDATHAAKTKTPQLTPGKKNASVAAAPVIVREIDVAALQKILRRDNVPRVDASSTASHPLLVNFWATWCDPCREEFPDLVRLNEDYKMRGLDFIVVSLDEVDELNKGVPQFLQQMHATMPAFLLNAPDQEAAMNAVDPQWGGALPATFLFDRNGQIVFKHMGRINPAETRAAIEKALKR